MHLSTPASPCPAPVLPPLTIPSPGIQPSENNPHGDIVDTYIGHCYDTIIYADGHTHTIRYGA